MEIREKRIIFVNCPVPEKFQRENYSGQVPHGILTHSGFRISGRGEEIFLDHVLAPRSWEMPVERKLPAKKGGVPLRRSVTILTLERNPPERKFLYMLKIFSQEDFALKSKLRPGGFLQHLLR